MPGSGLRLGATLSLTGRFARFGRQAAEGLRTWSTLTGAASLDIVDDESSVERVPLALRELRGRCDLLLGPYSTQLARAAAEYARDSDAVIANHGGAGDDVQRAAPGRLLSVLAPTSRYAESFVVAVAAAQPGARLLLVPGPGSFGRQIAGGAQESAQRWGLTVVRDDDGQDLPDAVFTAGTFEHDIDVVSALLDRPERPRFIGSVAAGVAAFAEAVAEPDGMFGVSQWVRGTGEHVEIGPSERDFVDAYNGEPDYPAVQAAAAAVIITRCARLAGSLATADLWAAATTLDTSTVFGPFRIDPRSGMQVGRSLPLVRWRDGRAEPA